MKRLFLIAAGFLMMASIRAQSSSERVGINTLSPQHPIHIREVEGTELGTLEPLLHVEYTNVNPDHVIAVSGLSTPSEGIGIGGLFRGGFIGAYGRVVAAGDFFYNGVAGHVTGSGSGTHTGVRGFVEGTGTNYGLLGNAAGVDDNYGIYGTAFGGTTNWAGYFASGDVHIENRLGIGQLTPSRSLDISASQAIARLSSTNAANGAILELNNESQSQSLLGGINFMSGESVLGQIAYTAENRLTFSTFGSERMRMDESGRVGIGTATPTSKLDVAGRVRIGEENITPEAGMVRWNAGKQDFEGFNGTIWISFSKPASSWGNLPLNQGVEDQKIVATDGAAEAAFGYSVAISGDYAIVGAYMANIVSNVKQGAAYIFHKSGDTWTQQAKITASDGAANDQFGNAVAIAGDYAIVGAFLDDIGANTNQGSAYIFYRTGSTWAQQAKLVANDGAIDDLFGRSVAISGDYAVVGANGDDIGGHWDQGSAYVFNRSGSTWSQQAKMTAADGETEDDFGWAVGISGDYVVVGAYRSHSQNRGAAYVYIRSGNLWTQQAKITASDWAPEDRFGNAVAIFGAYIIVGSYGADIDGDSDRGAAYIFFRTGSTWNQQAKITGSGGAPNDQFGNAVAMSGDYAIVGALLHDTGGITNQGAAYIYHRSGSSWSQQAKITGSDGAASDLFGVSVGMSGAHTIVGAHLDDVSGTTNQGSAYFFQRK